MIWWRNTHHRQDKASVNTKKKNGPKIKEIYRIARIVLMLKKIIYYLSEFSSAAYADTTDELIAAIITIKISMIYVTI